MLPGCIADDFTGATDLANTLVRAGMRTVQTIGVPAPGIVVGKSDAVVVALKSRTNPAADAIEKLEATARLYLLLRGERMRVLTDDQVAELRRRFPL